MSEVARLNSRVGEVFLAFLMLGLTAFGGPIAHLSYFRNEFVTRRRWLSEQDYADLVALCQFLPGPASSQVGFALGLMRAGGWGAAAAWTAFTLPSAVVLVLFALGSAFMEGPVSQGIIHGLKVAAVAIVAHAVWGMAQNLCPDKRRVGIALVAVLMALLVGGSAGQVGAIVIGAVVGLWSGCSGVGGRACRRRMTWRLASRDGPGGLQRSALSRCWPGCPCWLGPRHRLSLP